MTKPWAERPPEVANLFNPAFMGSLTYEYVKAHVKAKETDAPLTYLLVASTAVLHRPTRGRLPGTTITSLPSWSLANEDLLVGFANRQRGIRPYVLEGLRLALRASALKMGEGHGLALGERKVGFGARYLREATAEAKDIVDRMRFAARWFARSGSEATVLATWRVRP
ncbi:MAG: three component ABC system middle component [Pseudomonadota bacterium]